MSASMGKLAADLQILAQIIELVRPELKMLPGDLERVYGAIWRWWGKAMRDEPCVGLLDIKRIPVMSDQYIGLVKNLPEMLDKGFIALLVLLIGGKVRQSDRLYTIAFRELVSKGKNVPISIRVD